MHDHWSSPPRAQGGYGDPGRVDGNQRAFDNSFAGSGAIADVHPLAMEPFVVSVSPQRPLRAGRGNLEVVWTIDELGLIAERTGDAANALAVFNGYRLTV